MANIFPINSKSNKRDQLPKIQVKSEKQIQSKQNRIIIDLNQEYKEDQELLELLGCGKNLKYLIPSFLL